MNANAKTITYVQIVVLGLLTMATVALGIEHRNLSDRVAGLQDQLSVSMQRLAELFDQSEERFTDESRVITAAAFHLRDPSGRLVASLAVSDTGRPALVMNGPRRKAAVLDVSPDGAGRLRTYNPDGEETVWVGPGPSGDGMVSILGSAGRTAVEMSAANGRGNVSVYGTTGKPILRLYASDAGGGLVTAFGTNGDPRCGIGVSTNGQGFLAVHGADHDGDFARIGVTESGIGAVTTYDARGRTAVSIGATQGGAGSVATFGTTGTGLVSMSASSSGAGTLLTSDADGKPLVSLTASDAGSGRITTHAGDYKQIELGNDDRGDGRISTFNRDGAELVRIGAAAAGGNGYVSTYDKAGPGRVSVGVSGDGQGIVSTYGTNGMRLAGLGVAEDGSGVVSAHNADGQEVVVLGALRGGAGFLSTFTAAADTLIHLGARTDGSALITANGPQGERRFTAGGSGLQFYGSGSTTIASIGRDTNGDGIMVLSADGSKSQVRLFAGVSGGGLATFDHNGQATDRFPAQQNPPR